MRAVSKLYLCLVLSLTVWTSLACSTEPTATTTDPIAQAQLDLLPDSTRSVAWVKLAALLAGPAESEVRASLAGKGREPALSALLSTVSLHLVGVDPARVDGALIAQTTDPEAGFVLVASLAAEDALDLSRLRAEGSYRGQRLYAHAETGLQVAKPSGELMVVAQPKMLRAILDAQADAGEKARGAGAIGPYLTALDAAGALRFVVGLPALYRDLGLRDDDLTLRSALAVSGAVELSASGTSGQIVFHTPNAKAFVAAFTEGAGDKIALIAGEALGPKLPTRALLTFSDSPFPGGKVERLASRGTLKRLFHAMNEVNYAQGVRQGGNAPWMNFQVGTDPNSIFINFRFKDEAALKSFEQTELPAGFELAPLRILEEDEPGYFLVLNAYQSSGGLVTGGRAEWSVFVRDPADGKARFLVIQAAAQAVSADSVNLLTPAEPVRHELKANTIATYVGVKEGEAEKTYFESAISWPLPSAVKVNTAREFTSANDYIYWGNGVADRGLYNGTVYNRQALKVPAADIVVNDQSRWAQYLNSEPVHAFVYTVGLEIVVSPWWNLDASYLDVTAEHLQDLIDFKDSFYPGTIKTAAKNALGGGSALSTFEVANKTPSVFYQFAVLDPARLEKMLALPDGHKLSPMRIFEDDEEAGHYVTLAVFEVEGSPEGLRAEWYAYADDGSLHPHRMVLDVASADIRVDPLTLLGLPSTVTHTRKEMTLATRVASLHGRFSLALDLAQSVPGLPSRDWVEAHDRTCSLNGICDKVFYGGATLTDPVRRFGPESVKIDELKTPWEGLISKEPSIAYVRDGAQRFAANPWDNVP